MKRFLVLFLLLFLPSFANAKTPIEIISILDGDTVRAKIDNNKFDIRLIGIDCAETSKNNRAYKQAYLQNKDIDEILKEGKNAKKYLEFLLKKSKTTSFEFKGLDDYKRVLGVLYFGEININKKLKQDGYCKEYIYSSPHL